MGVWLWCVNHGDGCCCCISLTVIVPPDLFITPHFFLCVCVCGCDQNYRRVQSFICKWTHHKFPQLLLSPDSFWDLSSIWCHLYSFLFVPLSVQEGRERGDRSCCGFASSWTMLYLLRMSRSVPPKMLPLPSSHMWHVQRLLPASVWGPVSGQRQLPGPAAQRGQRTHAPGGLDEAAQVSRGRTQGVIESHRPEIHLDAGNRNSCVFA